MQHTIPIAVPRMNTVQDTRDRVIRLEQKVDHMERQQADMGRKVDEMHQLLTKARGAQWVFISIVAACGFAAGKIGSIIQMLRP